MPRLNCTGPDHDPTWDIAHSWRSTGLHIVRGQLHNTRTCVYCGMEMAKRYGAAKATWKEVPR